MRCPIALAVDRTTGRTCDVWNDCIWTRHYERVCSLPGSATQFIEDFDDGRPVQPIEFEVGLSEPRGEKIR